METRDSIDGIDVGVNSPLAGEINWMETITDWISSSRRLISSPLAGEINWMETHPFLPPAGVSDGLFTSPLAGEINWMETSFL